MVLSSNHVIVQFTSDDSNGDIGFLLHWSATNGTIDCCLHIKSINYMINLIRHVVKHIHLSSIYIGLKEV